MKKHIPCHCLVQTWLTSETLQEVAISVYENITTKQRIRRQFVRSEISNLPNFFGT